MKITNYTINSISDGIVDILFTFDDATELQEKLALSVNSKQELETEIIKYGTSYLQGVEQIKEKQLVKEITDIIGIKQDIIIDITTVESKQ